MACAFDVKKKGGFFEHQMKFMPFVFHTFSSPRIFFFFVNEPKQTLQKGTSKKKQFFQQHKIIDFPFSRHFLPFRKRNKIFCSFHVVPSSASHLRRWRGRILFDLSGKTFCRFRIKLQCLKMSQCFTSNANKTTFFYFLNYVQTEMECE